MRAACCFFALLIIAACARDDAHTGASDSPTRRQVDSAIGTSGLPGAGGVTNALEAADSAAARKAQLDSMNREP